MPDSSFLQYLPPEVLKQLTTEANSRWTDPNSGYSYAGYWQQDPESLQYQLTGNGIRGESPQTFGKGENALAKFSEVGMPVYDSNTGQFQQMGTGYFGGKKDDAMMNVGKALFGAIALAGLGNATGLLGGGGAGAGAGESVSGFYGPTAGELSAAGSSYGAGAGAGDLAMFGDSTASLGGGDYGISSGIGESVSGSYAPTAGELSSAASSYGASSGLLSPALNGVGESVSGSYAPTAAELSKAASSYGATSLLDTALKYAPGLLSAVAAGNADPQGGVRRELDPQVRDAIFGNTGGLSFARNLMNQPVAPNGFARWYS